MKRYLGISFVVFCSFLLLAGMSLAKQSPVQNQLVHETDQDLVGNVDGTLPVSNKALQDTVWIADWTFDNGSPCNSTGWVKYDNRVVNDGSNYWAVSTAYADSGSIVNKAAVLRKHDLCWAGDGYGNNWDYCICLFYKAVTRLSFVFVSDSEPGFDYVTVEADSACSANARAQALLPTQPRITPAQLRDELFSTSGLNTNGVVTNLALPDYGLPLIQHCVYIRFHADGGYSDEDGNYPTYYTAGLIVDNIVVDGTPFGAGGLDYSENFEGAINANVTFVNCGPAFGPGEFSRLFQHITDNDKCTENTTCAWLQTDPSRPAFFADMGFGPSGVVIKNWCDQIFVSPWVSLASTPTASGTVMSFRRFPGNDFSKGKIVQGWRVRAKVKVANTDTSAGGDSIDCITPWGHASSFSSLTNFGWITSIPDMSPYFSGLATEIQVSFREGDWQDINNEPPPVTLDTGPGPYTDRVRIGRRVLGGPVINEGIDSRSQAQDAFGAQISPVPGGTHHDPSTSATRRFDAVPFDQGSDLGTGNTTQRLITGDSIHVAVTDVRLANGIKSVKLYGQIISGPHAGKRPPGTVAGPGGFFAITADSARNSSGVVIANNWAVDLDDSYMRGGDILVYFWGAADNNLGFTSDPIGIANDGTGNPNVSSAQDAENQTLGLLEMSALPAINWDPTYLAAVAALPQGSADPGPSAGQITNSTQKNCILYYNEFSTRRRSGLLNRTSFMYTLDRLGYRGHYDVFDVQGYGNTNNQLGSRATVAHMTGYALIVQDTGRLGTTTLPDGVSWDAEKIDMGGFYRGYLDGGLSSAVGTATLWIVGENVIQEKGTNALFSGTYMGLSLGNTNNGSGSLNPDVQGQGNFTFQNGCIGAFGTDLFSLNGGCPTIRNYDGLTASTGTVTHKYKAGTVVSPYAAIIMNKNTTLKWNSIMSSFGWFDIRDAFGGSPGRAEKDLAGKILNCVLTCALGENPVGTDPPQVDVPKVTTLYQNVPNPFNPTTTIKFDLARDGHVKLQVFDVAGHLVRTLANQKMVAGRNLSVTWNGMNDKGSRVSSGVYFYQLVTDDFTATKKMVVLK